MEIKCSASLVLYNSAPEVFVSSVRFFLDGIHGGILVISDHSETLTFHSVFEHLLMLSEFWGHFTQNK